MHLPIGSGLVTTALLLGITHGLEPDHVAGITALTQDAADPRRSAVVGGLFGLGHALFVVVWIAGAYLVFDTTSFPPAYEQVGLLLVGVVLALLSLSLGLSGLRRLVHRHEHEHDGDRHAHFHVHLPVGDLPDHEHRHTLREYVTVGIVGALFTLSPPVSMIAFVSLTLAERSSPLLVGIVAVYTAAIVATLGVVGGSSGTIVRVIQARGERVHAAFQVVVSVLVLAVAVHLFVEAAPVLSGLGV